MAGGGSSSAAAMRPHSASGAGGAAVGQVGRGLQVLGQLGSTARAVDQMGLDRGALVGVDGIERVGADQLLDLGHVERFGHCAPPIPASISSTRSFLSPLRIRLFTVPSGSPSRTATSR